MAGGLQIRHDRQVCENEADTMVSVPPAPVFSEHKNELRRTRDENGHRVTDLLFSVKVTAIGLSMVSVFKDNVLMKNKKKAYIRFERIDDTNVRLRLIIRKLNNGDTGTFDLLARSTFGTACYSFSLFIRGMTPPVVNSPMKVIMENGRCLLIMKVLQVTADMYQVEWFKDDIKITNDGINYEFRQKLYNSPCNYACLLIKKSGSSIMGKYTAVVKNESGEARGSFNLQSLPEPPFVSGPAQIIAVPTGLKEPKTHGEMINVEIRIPYTSTAFYGQHHIIWCLNRPLLKEEIEMEGYEKNIIKKSPYEYIATLKFSVKMKEDYRCYKCFFFDEHGRTEGYAILTTRGLSKYPWEVPPKKMPKTLSVEEKLMKKLTFYQII